MTRKPAPIEGSGRFVAAMAMAISAIQPKRWKCARATTRLLSQECLEGELSPEKIDMEALNRHMYTGSQPDVDLLIRTGGDERISNFLLWQSWYAELIFEKTFWPDYDKQKLFEDLNIYAGRERRFGRVKEK